MKRCTVCHQSINRGTTGGQRRGLYCLVCETVRIMKTWTYPPTKGTRG